MLAMRTNTQATVNGGMTVGGNYRFGDFVMRLRFFLQSGHCLVSGVASTCSTRS